MGVIGKKSKKWKWTAPEKWSFWEARDHLLIHYKNFTRSNPLVRLFKLVIPSFRTLRNDLFEYIINLKICLFLPIDNMNNHEFFGGTFFGWPNQFVILSGFVPTLPDDTDPDNGNLHP